jgi:flavin reductase (DIM6/NTAB) family NADH-FMN oxidoreductase RutF
MAEAENMRDGTTEGGLDVATGDLDARSLYGLLTSLVVPRPIAWVSTVSPDGQRNLAPHSYFNLISSSPPIIHVTSSQRRGRLKDTAHNIAETGEFVVNVASREQIELANHTAAEWPADEDEWTWAGVTGLPSRLVAPERVAGAPAAMECRLVETVALGNGTMFFGEVVWFHVDARVMDSSRVNVRALDPVARLGGPLYTPLGEVFQLVRPDWEQLRDGAPAPAAEPAPAVHAEPASQAPLA